MNSSEEETMAISVGRNGTEENVYMENIINEVNAM